MKEGNEISLPHQWFVCKRYTPWKYVFLPVTQTHEKSVRVLVVVLCYV